MYRKFAGTISLSLLVASVAFADRPAVELEQSTGEMMLAVTREDADDLYFAMNLFRENGIVIDKVRIKRVMRETDGGAHVWVENEYAGLPVFSSTFYFTFDSRRRVARDEQSGDLLLRGSAMHSPESFPIDHEANIAAGAAIETWRKAISDDELLGLGFEPRNLPVATLGFSNHHFSGTANNQLVWRVAPDGGSSPVAFIDAKTGDLLLFDSGVRTTLETTATPAEVSIDLLGTWASKSCAGRPFTRVLILESNETFRIVDRARETYQGKWHSTRPGSISLEMEMPDGGEPASWAGHFSFDPHTGLLHEAQPGMLLCHYTRVADDQ